MKKKGRKKRGRDIGMTIEEMEERIRGRKEGRGKDVQVERKGKRNMGLGNKGKSERTEGKRNK